MPAFWVVLFQNHLVMKTNVIYSLRIMSHGLPPRSSRLFKATSYCAKEYQLLINFQFQIQCETESDTDQLHVQMSERCWEKEKGSSFPLGYWEARETAILNRAKGFLFSAVSGNTPQLCNRSPVLQRHSQQHSSLMPVPILVHLTHVILPFILVSKIDLKRNMRIRNTYPNSYFLRQL